MTIDVSHLKLGRLAAQFPEGLDRLTAYRTDPFPAPPEKVLYPAVADYGMDGNDRLGDCTIAGVDHLIAAWNAEFAEKDPRPTEKAIEAEYRKLSPDDQGCVESQVLEVWRKSGMWGNKIKAYAPFDHSNTTELKQGVAFLGGVYLGIECPESMQQQFAAGQPITYVAGSPIEGGHCIVAVGYDSTGFYCVTWGKVVHVSSQFLSHYCEEAWGVISNELAEKGSDAHGLNLAALEADLNALGQAA